MPDNELLNAALLYASFGWHVFPLVPHGKDPVTKHGFKDATTDTGQIKKWWSRHDYNIGIATGDGLCVIDVDDKDKNPVQGSDMLREWELEHGDIAETCRAITGTGGIHYLYDVDDTEIPCCQSDTIYIDIRCDGGYIVAPPSIHPDTGTAYTWDISPEDMIPTKAGSVERACIQWVYDNRKGANENGTKGKFKAPDVVHEGEGRDETLYKIACSMWAQNMPKSTILAALMDYNEHNCKPPMPKRIVEQKVRSATSNPAGTNNGKKDGKQKSHSRKFPHNSVAQKLIREYGACKIDGVTPAIRDGKGRYLMGWDAFDSAIIDIHDDCTDSNRREVKSYIKAKAPSRTQSPWNLIAFENGVLDVLTMEFRDWSDTDVITNVIPHKWNPDAYDETLFRTLEKMSCGDTATMMNLGEFIGICMMRSVTRMPFYPVLIGVGSNGKSTYIKLLKRVLGADNISALQPKELSARFMGEHIVGKLANLGDDIANSFLDGNECGAIKRISTGENIFTDVKGTKGFYFEPYCTMVFSCNQFPRCADTTDGFMRRLFPIEFNARFTPSDDDYDPLVGEKLATENALEYACVLGVENLHRALKKNAPTANRISEAVKQGIASEGNTGLQWFNDEGISRDWILDKTKEEVWRKYEEWCQRNGYGKTAMASGTLSALIGTYWHLSCTKTAHSGVGSDRKTVKVYEYKGAKGAKGATNKAQVKA